MDQHVQVPNKVNTLEPYDLLVYAGIKRYENKDTHTAFPSIDTVMENTGLGRKQINSSLCKLQECGWITITKRQNQSSIYLFNKVDDGFEMFSFEFLDMDAPKYVKAFIVAAQKYMYKNNLLLDGTIGYTEEEVARKINSNRRFVHNANRWMEEHGMLTTVNIRKKDKETGLYMQDRIYELDKLQQAIVFKIKEHDEKFEIVEDKFIEQEEKMKIMMKRIELLEKQLARKTIVL